MQKKIEIRPHWPELWAKTGGKWPKFEFFATFGHLATPRRPYTPVITSRHISYMISDMSEHYSDHFRGVSGRFKGPRGPKNCDFQGF